LKFIVSALVSQDTSSIKENVDRCPIKSDVMTIEGEKIKWHDEIFIEIGGRSARDVSTKEFCLVSSLFRVDGVHQTEQDACFDHEEERPMARPISQCALTLFE
jgi:hypothetical protein